MGTATAFDVRKVRSEFPILSRKVRGKPLVYLDNAATTQKPRVVLDAIRNYYETLNSNIHRGVHHLSELATKAYEDARLKARAFLNAADAREIVFVRGATEGINLVAHSFGRTYLRPGDEVLVTAMEHHSNIVPWQMLRDERGIVLKVAPIADDGSLILDEFEKRLSPKTKLVAVAHVSNALGTVNPVKRIVERAHARGIPVLVDGAQAAPHLKIDVQDLGCDFYALSGHKVYAPTGIGVLYGKAHLLEEMPPYQGGGEMILSVTFEKTVYNRIPHKFEAGTPNIEGVIGLGAAIDYLTGLGLDAVAAHEEALLEHGTKVLSAVKGLRIIGTAPEKAGVISFVLGDIHAHDIGTILDREGIAIRTGHHCAQPVMDRFGVPATARASLGVYNTTEDLDALAAGLRRVEEVFGS
ncbi:MAG TPA: cysteine desulfurase [Planctomycetota bacterium]|nr:cysteine desulfurase [Planctomycetota bacterium]